MSGAVQFHTPENRLAKLMRVPGGKRVADALADADKGLDGLRGECLDELTAVLSKAEKLVAKAGALPGAALVGRLYALVSATIGLPTTCGLPSLDAMLVSLSDLLDHMTSAKTWDADAVEVHLRAFRLLLHTEAARDGAGAEAILGGLRQISQRYAK